MHPESRLYLTLSTLGYNNLTIRLVACLRHPNYDLLVRVLHQSKGRHDEVGWIFTFPMKPELTAKQDQPHNGQANLPSH